MSSSTEATTHAVQRRLHGGDPSADLLSIIVPVYNERAVLPTFHARLLSAIACVCAQVEILYVDDGSTDGSSLWLSALQCSDQAVGVLRFSRNFGKEQAISAGLQHARGDAVIVIDADLQDPPELIVSMVQAWREGADMVNMHRHCRAGETWLKRATAHVFYRAINTLSDVHIPPDVGDFRLLSRRAIDALNSMPERTRFMKGLFAWIGFEQVTIDYDRAPRAAGQSKWRYWRLWNLALEAITGFSTAPLKAASYLGIFSAMAALIYAVYFLIKTLIVGDPVSGFPTLIVTMLFLGGIQLVALGVLGEYVSRLAVEVKHRPLYLIDRFDPPHIAAQRTAH